jgi:exonuclease III
MKSNNHKMELIHEWALDNKIDILGLAETNISKKEGFFIAKDLDKYRSFWSDSNATKKKGSGVGILVEERWERHLGQIDRVNEYMIVANFIFKQLELMVIMIYMPPNNKEEQRRIQRAIIERYIKRTYRTQIVIMGDLNCIVDPELDRSSILKYSSFKKEPIIKWLIGQNFKDSFRIGNPKSKEFSWTNGESSTRIDQIWMTEELASGLIDAEIQDMSSCTNSDHSAAVARLELNHITAWHKVSKLKKLEQYRTIFLYEKAAKEDWEKYREELDRMLKNKNLAQRMEKSRWEYTEKSKEDLDEIWEVLSKSILEAARKSLPKKKVLNTTKNKKNNKARKSELTKALSQLGRWISLGKKNIKLGLISENIEDFNIIVEYINEQHKTSIEKITEIWTEEIISDVRGWWKILYKRRAEEIERQRLKEIEQNIERRCQMINGKQGRMLMSLLDKPLNKIRIDRLVELEDLNRKLITNPQKVLEKTKKHFQQQFRI